MNRTSLNGTVVWLLLILLISGFLADGVFAAEKEAKAAKPENQTTELSADGADKKKKATESNAGATNRLTREGLVVDFSITPIARRAAGGKKLMEGDYAEVTFRITDAVNRKPVSGLYPAAWMDISKPWWGKQSGKINCKDRVALYIQGRLGSRPQIDLNSYFVMVMNRDATISVYDPLVDVAGMTQLYAMVTLKQPGADWVNTSDDKRMFVVMPRAHEVAVVDTDTFKVIENLPAGRDPLRIVLQPDEKYLWVGNDSRKTGESGVTVIDVETGRVAAHIPTGKGHHELAVSADNRYAFVSNRDDGTVSVIDIQQLKKVKDIETGQLPISIAYSSLSQMLYVADATTGVVSVVDGQSQEVVMRLKTQPGLGPLRFSQDGRWGMVVNPQKDVVYVIDAATNQLAHTIPVEGQPYEIGFSRAFAYVRALRSEWVSMINLVELGMGRRPPVVKFAAGQKPPGEAADLSLAGGITEAPGEAAVLVVSPADETVYYYMEGMNAPKGALRNDGHRPRAVGIVDRALREKAPGVYSGQVQIPTAGTYDVAFLLDAPRILHCFSTVAEPNPSVKRKLKPLAIEYLLKDRRVTVGETMRLRFRLTDPATKQPRTALADVRVLYYLAPGQWRTVVPAREVEDGLYEAALPIRRGGAYYVYVGVPSLKMRFDQLPYMTLRAVKKRGPAGAKERAKKVNIEEGS